MSKALVYGIASACAVALVLLATLEVPLLRSKARQLYYAVRSQHTLRVGDVLPPIRLSDLRGLPVTLTARRNHVLLINVFATWCVPCQSEMPALAALDRHVPRGTEIVERGKTGCVSSGWNEGDLARDLQFLMNRPERRLEMARLARARVEARFSLAATARAHHALYEELHNRRMKVRGAHRRHYQQIPV